MNQSVVKDKKAARVLFLDLAAVSLSSLCLVHCLALPFLAAFVPVLGLFAQGEWVHWAFLGFAAPVSLIAFTSWSSTRTWTIPMVAGFGLVLLLLGALQHTRVWETMLTIFGGLSLACAHLLNWRWRHSHKHP